MNYQCFNHSTFKLKSSVADEVALKGENKPVQVYSFINGVCEIDTTDFSAGFYLLQFFRGDDVIEQSTLNVKENLKYVDESYQVKSQAQIVLEAIEAYLAGRASSQQKEVSVGDKRISYSSFDQLIKWRDFYQKQVRKETGKSPNLRFEKIRYKGI